MATVTLSVTLSLSGTSNNTQGHVSKTITQVSEINTIGSQLIGTSTEAINFGDVTAPGYMMIINEDATNFVQIGTANPVTPEAAVSKLLPGEALVLPTRLATWYALADTAQLTISKHILSL